MSEWPRQKRFHGTWDGTTHYEFGDCEDCEAVDVKVAVFVAEENWGEFYGVRVCADCLRRHSEAMAGEEE